MAISSKYLSEVFDITHRHLLRNIVNLIDDHPDLSCFVTETTYTSVQNKKLKCFILEGNALSLLLGMKSFSKSEKDEKEKRNIIKNEGLDCVAIRGVYTRFEDSFYGVLSKIIHPKEIKRQFNVLRYRVDFYIKNANIIIEYDEEQHMSNKVKEADSVRIEEIKNHIMKTKKITPIVIRVKKGSESEGIGLICAYISSLYPDAFRYNNLVLSAYTHNI